MKKFLSVLVIGAAGAGLACGDSGTGPTGDIMTEAELAVVASEIIGVALVSGVGGAAPPPAQGAYSVAPPVTFDVGIDQTVPCGVSGSMNLSGNMAGTVDSEAGTGSIDLNFTQTPSSCGVETQFGVFVIDGDPNLVLEGSISWGADGAVGTSIFTYKGGFAWSQGDRSGTCGIDIELTWSGTAASYTGSVCGQTFDVSVAVG